MTNAKETQCYILALLIRTAVRNLVPRFLVEKANQEIWVEDYRSRWY